MEPDAPQRHAKATPDTALDISGSQPLTASPSADGRIKANTKTKMIKRQMYGRAGFHLLRHRRLLN
ncbi:hypothetical protein ACFYRG_50055 [Streptomyces mirabilis]|uniref:hypothetical protein n=1 Tax=Streptomyces mirabilis TaxID=68239 RepID=UPI003692F558